MTLAQRLERIEQKLDVILAAQGDPAALENAEVEREYREAKEAMRHNPKPMLRFIKNHPGFFPKHTERLLHLQPTLKKSIPPHRGPVNVKLKG